MSVSSSLSSGAGHDDEHVSWNGYYVAGDKFAGCWLHRFGKHSLPIRTRVFLNGRISHGGSSHFNFIRSFMTSDRDGQDGGIVVKMK